eukprot:TRINITY_DN65038_c0_g1_i1.p1 TRINITY_DN65038_c0_g1~~TRINITY_DN65038_c0_g1_i1.p1  ORF type:complete len:192 (+),score=23.03 TRINITY_DN65038_c0_g1_i1:58-633(+)
MNPSDTFAFGQQSGGRSSTFSYAGKSGFPEAAHLDAADCQGNRGTSGNDGTWLTYHESDIGDGVMGLPLTVRHSCATDLEDGCDDVGTPLACPQCPHDGGLAFDLALELERQAEEQAAVDGETWLFAPSIGSVGHATGSCRPCAHHWKVSGCSKGNTCSFCHVCDKGALKRRQQYKRTAMKRQAGQIPGPR